MDLIHLQAHIHIQIFHLEIYILSYVCAHAASGGSRPAHLVFGNAFVFDRLAKAESSRDS